MLISTSVLQDKITQHIPAFMQRFRTDSKQLVGRTGSLSFFFFFFRIAYNPDRVGKAKKYTYVSLTKLMVDH